MEQSNLGDASVNSSEFATDQARWVAVEARDRAADGHFVFAVKTTGVYCQPSSASRRPKRENVEFFNNAADAEAAGYRPSRRSQKDQSTSGLPRASAITRACRLIEHVEHVLDLKSLAAEVAMSPSHFHRVFKSETGVTPKAYFSANRARRLRAQLGTSRKITEAIYGAGFNSNSRMYEEYHALLGMRPQDYRDGGRNTEIRFAVGQTSLGSILVAMSRQGICSITLGYEPDEMVRALQDQFPKAHLIGADAQFESLVAQVVGLVESPSLGLNLPLDIRGTAFQQRVWLALREIPAGTTVTYTDIAARIKVPKAVRAVAQACAANRIAIAIPCHRVVRRDGDISGYRWGVERKRELLKREGASASDKSTP
jgi:AraC family transcriptional regulator of adaptative response/methylated-DNA-[protein]-cysteine methyltransferase